MPAQSGGGENGPGHLDEFYAECDEHLTEIRRSLAALESVPDKTDLPRDVLDPLFRHLHSLKGILGMAGLAECERLAHGAEDYLRALSRHEAQLSDEGFETLTGVARMLEHALVAHRRNESLPDLGPVSESVTRLIHRSPSPEAPAAPAPVGAETAPQGKLHRAQHAQKHIFRAVFRPSPTLNQAGVNINTVRARLQQLGEIIQSTPKVETGGSISFEFLVAANEKPADLSPWNENGMTLSVADVPTPAPGAERESSGSSRTHAPPSAPAYLTPSHMVRVDLSRLDELMRDMGELVVHRARFEESLKRVSGFLPAHEARVFQEISYSLGRGLRRLRDGLMRVRLVPVAEIFERMFLVVRDLAREKGRKIQLNVRGQETQIDKYIVERLKDPVLHLVRNAATHGLESTEERAARGKPEALTISLRAATLGESVVLEVEDDGQGIDAQNIRRRAEESGISLPEELTEAELLEVMCLPGFSTREEADRVAGRGVGMAVVKDTVTSLGGEIRLHSKPGHGTNFTLRLPLTLAIADALLITVAEQRFAVPQTGLQEIATLEARRVQRLEEAEFMQYREGILPLLRLAKLFQLAESAKTEHPVLVIGHGADRIGVVVDRVLGQREIMVRALSDPLFKIPGVSGATELGDGQAVLILDVLGLVQMARNAKSTAVRSSAANLVPEVSYA
ncbi:MAG TPA: chemotaxis protein CheA [Clostridia bacterium]|nr:chemotaxis protein CheA [Clostridia bacterium]